MLTKLILLVALLILGGLVLTGKLPLGNTEKRVKQSFSQFIEQTGGDKYIIASRKTNEKFTITKFGLIKDTDADISLVAHYEFYIKLAELKHHIENGIVFVDVLRLYLSTPVAFNFDSVTENCNGLFGLDCKELFTQLKQDISTDLINKGTNQIPSLYDIAAKSLADNLNNYFTNQHLNHYYKSIVIRFTAEKSTSQRQFNYNAEYCNQEPCLLKFDLSKTHE